MAESPLPGKKKSRSFSFGRSLALRILFVFFVSLIIPLTFHFFTMSKRDYRLRLKQTLLELDVIATMHETTLDRQLFVQEKTLETISAFPPFEEMAATGQPSSEVNELFADIAKEQHLASLFYLEIDSEGAAISVASTYPERIGTVFPPGTHFLTKENFALLANNGTLVHLRKDPWTEVKQLYLSIPIYNDQTGELKGALSSGLDAQDMIDHMDLLEKGKYPFDVSLITDEREVFVSSNPYFSFRNLVMFSGDKLIEDPNQTELLDTLTKRLLMSGKESHIGLKIPVRNTDFFLLVEVPEKFLLKVQRQDNFIRLGSFFLFILLIGGTITFWLTFRMARPLQQLSDLMGKVGVGSFELRYKKDIFGFELNRLGERFNEMERDLSLYIDAVKIERVAKDRITSELKIGHEIQKRILPRKMPEFPGLDIASGFTPAREVGGDFYDLYVKRDVQPNQLVIAIADASGKGITACFYSLCLRSMLRSYDSTYGDLPRIIRSTNNLFCLDTGDTGMFVTAWVGIYDPETKIIKFSSCGHHPAIIKRKDGSLIEVTTSGIALGVAPFDKVKADQFQLETGDWVILYTDGVLDARDSEGSHFGKERFLDLIRAVPDPDAQGLINRVTSTILDFSKERILEDDVTLLVLRIL